MRPEVDARRPLRSVSVRAAARTAAPSLVSTSHCLDFVCEGPPHKPPWRAPERDRVTFRHSKGGSVAGG